MSDITVSRFSTLADVDAEEWDSIIDEGDILDSYGYQLAIARSGVNGFRYNYLVMRRQGKLVAHVSVGIFAFGLEGMLTGGLKKAVEFIKRVFPSFLRITLIECGHPTALGNTFAAADPRDLPEIIEIAAEEMEKIAEKEKTSLYAIRDAYAADREHFDVLLDKGFRVAPNFSNTFVHIRERSFDEYLDGLVTKRRHEIRSRIAAFEKAGCTIEKVHGFSGLSETLASLCFDTCKRAKEYQREILTPEYFRGMSELLGERAFALVCRKEGKIIGFTMLLDSGDELISTYCGLDYTLNRSTYTYFALFYQSIKEAIAMGKEWLELGITNYLPKIELGAIPEPLAMYVRSSNPLVNLFFAPALRLSFSRSSIGERSIFNERHYRLCALRAPTVVNLEGRAYRVTRAEAASLSLEGPAQLSKSEHNIFIGDVGRHGLLLAARVVSASRLSESVWDMELSIVAMNSEHSFAWKDYLRRRAAAAHSHWSVGEGPRAP